jgi:hypothetical protein
MMRFLRIRRSGRNQTNRYLRRISRTRSSKSSFNTICAISICAALPIGSNGAVTFPGAVDVGENYAVTIVGQPTSLAQNCTVTNGVGTVGNGNATDVAVSCLTLSPGARGAAATRLYFANGAEYGGLGGGQEGWLSSLVGYPANSRGSVNATLTTSTNLTDRYICVTTDVSGYIYVTTHGAFGPSKFSGVLVFAPDQNAKATPSRTLTVRGFPGVIALDRAGDVYVTTVFPSSTGEAPSAELLEFAAGASGHATPIRTINLSEACTQLAVDANRNILCASFRYMSNEIRVFTGGPPGNATPARTISLDSNLQVIDFSLDPFGNIFVAVQDNGTRILELPGGAGGTGVLSPVPGIPDGTLGSTLFVTHLRFDAADNLYVFGVAEGAGRSLLRFAPAGGGFAPAVSETLTSPTFPVGFAEPIVAGFAVH